MSVKAATHGKGRAILNASLKEHKAFSTSGALNAKEYNGQHKSIGYGQLNSTEIAQLDADYADIVYVVYSYVTPIAWVKSDGTVYRVSQRFSVTTSKHQGTLYLL